MLITALSEAIRESADGYGPDDIEMRPGYKALLEWADDFEERTLDQL